MAAGRPVVATRVGGVAEMVDELRHEFAEVDPATAEGDLKRALGELVSLGLVVDLP